ncbi:hypothetical protein JB92DRAFT_755076 [Gautieria morchelliformis]|nr:hypothetical protein JB92DRAFT_755076 [Gautieria morchelliformis]
MVHVHRTPSAPTARTVHVHRPPVCKHGARAPCTLPTYGALEPYALSTLHVRFTSTVLACTYGARAPSCRTQVRFASTVRSTHVRCTGTARTNGAREPTAPCACTYGSHPPSATSTYGARAPSRRMHVRFVCTVRCTHVRCTRTVPPHARSVHIHRPPSPRTVHVHHPAACTYGSCAPSAVRTYGARAPSRRMHVRFTSTVRHLHVRFVCTVRHLHVRCTGTIPPHARTVRVHHPLYARGR